MECSDISISSRIQDIIDEIDISEHSIHTLQDNINIRKTKQQEYRNLIINNKLLEKKISLELKEAIKNFKLLDSRIEIAQAKSVKIYKYYMNFYTSDCKVLKEKIYILNNDISKLNKKVIDTKLENDRIKILKVLVLDINKLLA
jgi:hypothetical protein